MKTKTSNRRRFVASSVAALVIGAGNLAGGGSAQAAVTDNNWSGICGNGTFGSTGSIQAGSIMNSASGYCWHYAQAKCQSQSGAIQWQNGSKKGLGQLSTRTCSGSYNHNMLNVGVKYGNT